MCINKTELKLYEYLIKIYPTLTKQQKLETCKFKTYLPFDFCIPEIKTIIELDGAQHFKQVSNWLCPEKTIERDCFKMQRANKEGYKVIRINQEDVYDSNEIWLDKNLLSEIKNQDRENRYISKNVGLYEGHKSLLHKGMEIALI
jgi:very-short-patch-repair endonuclease